MELTIASPFSEERELLCVRSLVPYFNQETAQISVRRLDIGIADHGSQYHKISLYINGIPSQIVNKKSL